MTEQVQRRALAGEQAARGRIRPSEFDSGIDGGAIGDDEFDRCIGATHHLDHRCRDRQSRNRARTTGDEASPAQMVRIDRRRRRDVGAVTQVLAQREGNQRLYTVRIEPACRQL